MTRVVLILFLIGHILGDFYFQSSELSKSKEKSFKKLLIHGVIYLITMIFAIIPIFSFVLLKWSCIISVCHFIIDFIKFMIKKRLSIDGKTEAFVYSIDQIIHIFIIILTVLAITLLSEPITYISCVRYVLTRVKIDIVAVFSWILILLVITKPFSITIKKLLFHFRPAENKEEKSTANAGALIGILERCIILLLLFLNQYSAIGFVLTAKSIARYNKIADNPSFSEYYLLGTLLSTMLVIIAYLLIF